MAIIEYSPFYVINPLRFSFVIIIFITIHKNIGYVKIKIIASEFYNNRENFYILFSAYVLLKPMVVLF